LKGNKNMEALFIIAFGYALSTLTFAVSISFSYVLLLLLQYVNSNLLGFLIPDVTISAMLVIVTSIAMSTSLKFVTIADGSSA